MSRKAAAVRAHNREGPRGRRSELERLLDRTVLEPTHPELGTCWQFTGTATPYGRIAKAQDRQVRISGSIRERGHEPAGHAFGRASAGSGRRRVAIEPTNQT